MRALIVKEFRELLRDRRTLVMLIAFPVLLLLIFGYAANFTVEKISVTIVGPAAENLRQEVEVFAEKSEKITIVESNSSWGESDAERLLREQKSDVVIFAKDAPEGAPLTEKAHVYIDGSHLFSAQASSKLFTEIAGMRSAAPGVVSPASQAPTAVPAGSTPAIPAESKPTPSAQPSSASPPSDFMTVLFNPDLETSWVMIPGLIGLVLTFIGTLITSIGLVRERETGTLEQLAVMPLRPSVVILGKIIPYFLLAIIDMVLITVLGVVVFGVPFAGSIVAFSLAALIFLFVVLGLGVMISVASSTTGQAIQMAIMMVMPQVLLSGLIFPLESMAVGVRWIGYILPLTWFNQISQGIMLRGVGLADLWLPVLVLSAQALVIFGVATLRMRRLLTTGGAH